jgi:hypothetical protein
VEPIVSGVIAEMKAREIDLLVVDPFISTHEVDENDNSGIQQVAAQWVRIAHEANASVELVHHVRKANGRELTADDGRGASALKDKARAVEVINAMTAEEAVNAGIPAHERLSYFSVDPRNSKVNMSARTGFADWFRIVSQPLGNGGAGNLADAMGDYVGVVTQWAWPKAADIVGDVSAEDLQAIKRRLRTGIYRENPQANDWAGKVIAEILGIDVRDKSVRRRIQAMLKAWIATDHLYVDQRPNGARQKKNHIMVIGDDGENEPCIDDGKPDIGDDEPNATPLDSEVEQG